VAALIDRREALRRSLGVRSAAASMQCGAKCPPARRRCLWRLREVLLRRRHRPVARGAV